MSFQAWAAKQGFTQADLAGTLHELEGCWEAAVLAERKRCASLCDHVAQVSEVSGVGIARMAAVSSATTCATLIRKAV